MPITQVENKQYRRQEKVLRETKTCDALTRIFPEIMEAGWDESNQLSLIAFFCMFVDDYFYERRTEDKIDQLLSHQEEGRTEEQKNKYDSTNGTLEFPTKKQS